MFQIVLVPGATPQEFTQARAKRYKESVVSELTEDGEFIRVVAHNEYIEWGDTVPAPKKAVSEKKPAPKKKKKANKPKEDAIPDDTSLENIDVSSL